MSLGTNTCIEKMQKIFDTKKNFLTLFLRKSSGSPEFFCFIKKHF
jgi:hypothetical protein